MQTDGPCAVVQQTPVMTLTGGRGTDAEALGPLLAAIANGNRTAFEELYQQTSGRLLAIAHHFLGAGDDAEDVIHDVYLTVWNKAALYDLGRARPMAWLTAITRNRCIDRLRRRRRRTLVSTDWLSSLPDESADALLRVERDDQGRRLLACLDRLAADQKHAVRSAFFGGQTYEAVATALNVPLPTLKSRIRRALLLMRQCLQP